MKDRADPLLLSLLEKIANPLDSLNLTVNVKGVFAPSQQWKQSDEANSNIFTYSLDVCQMLFTSGKIEPRKLTEKELKEQEQAKNKKGSKKESKEEEKPQEEDPEAEKKRLEWEALSEEERFHRTQEDPFKAFSLTWTDHAKEQELKEDSLKTFEDSVSEGSLQIVLVRKPEGGEEEIAKLKKAKPKGLNLGELYSAQYTGRLNLKELETPGATTTTQRIPLEFTGQLPADCIRIDADKCYALVELTLSQAINPEVKEQKPSARELLGEPSKKGEESNLLGRLASEIKKGMKVISQEYSTFFSKEKEHGSDDRRLNTSNVHNLLSVSTLRINQISKRKDQFLAEFAASGKYSILRQKISKTVKAIIIDRCRKEKCGAAVAKEQLQRTLSQLNVFFRQMASKTLDEGVASEGNSLHEDLVLGHEYHRAGRKQALAGIEESKEERETRLAHEYQIVNKISEADEKYINLVLLNNNSISSLQNYARFCLRHSYYNKAYALYTQIAQECAQFKYQLIVSLFQAQRGRNKEAIQVLTKLAERECSSQQKTLVHNLLSFLYQRLGEQKKYQKHWALAQKYHLLKANPHMKINPPKNPYLEPTPKVPKPGKYISQLTQFDSQEMRYELMNYLVDYNFYQLAKEYLPKLQASDKKNKILALIFASESKFQDAIDVLEAILEKDNKNIQVLLLKADICFLSQKLFQCEEVFLFLLTLKTTPHQNYEIYLRLGLTYLYRKSWEDAKAIFNKAVQLRPNSSAGWLGLGVANLRLSLLEESQEALNLSSTYNPLSSEANQYLKEIQIKVNQFHQTNYQYINGVIT